jgi:hypothetical protein
MAKSKSGSKSLAKRFRSRKSRSCAKLAAAGVRGGVCFGTKRQVFQGTAQKTVGGLLKHDLVKNKRGKIVSKKQQAQGRRLHRSLVLMGLITRPSVASPAAPRSPSGPSGQRAAPESKLTAAARGCSPPLCLPAQSDPLIDPSRSRRPPPFALPPSSHQPK